MAGSMDLIMGTVELSDDTIAELVKNSEFAARVLRTLRAKMEEVVGEKNQVTASRVFGVIDGELDAFEAGTNPNTWRRALTKDDGRDAGRLARAGREAAHAIVPKPIKDSPQA